jgi:ATP-binding cassette subfamily C protein
MAARSEAFSAIQISALDEALKSAIPGLAIAFGFGVVTNLLGLVAPLYMLQVYDRVLTSHSIPSLIGLTLIAAFLFAVQAALDRLRGSILARAGLAVDEVGAKPIFQAIHQAMLKRPRAETLQALRDLDALRETIAGHALLTLCDLPWIPVYLFAAFALDPLYGWLTLGGSVIILGLALLNDRLTAGPLARAQKGNIAAHAQAGATMRNAEIIQAMGMFDALYRRWVDAHMRALSAQHLASDRAGVIVAATKFSRALLQSVILGAGAYLVIERAVSPGMMLAASIIIGRALAPIEATVASWKTLRGAASAYNRVSQLLAQQPPAPDRMELPEPTGAVSVESLVLHAPGRSQPILRNVSLALPAGSTLAIIGESASGKSSLARALVGIWRPSNGTVRLDAADLRHYQAETLGRHIGYLPQDVELFAGTIAENIARFERVDAQAVIEAARIAGVDQMIQRLPDGYDTDIEEGGSALSGGQRQRIGLARALYRLPRLIVLDEPNANLDGPGEQALIGAIAACKAAGRTVVVITHKTNLLAQVDYIAGLRDGALHSFGTRDQILGQHFTPRMVAAQ